MTRQEILTTQQQELLIEKALQAREKAYAPYSNYQVGAALLASNGDIYTGCNVENAAYPACICAERTAVVKAVSEGEKDFVAIVVATSNGGTPCGECRQVLNEFNPEMQVLIVNDEGQVTSDIILKDLLPLGFGPANLT